MTTSQKILHLNWSIEAVNNIITFFKTGTGYFDVKVKECVRQSRLCNNCWIQKSAVLGGCLVVPFCMKESDNLSIGDIIRSYFNGNVFEINGITTKWFKLRIASIKENTIVPLSEAKTGFENTYGSGFKKEKFSLLKWDD